MAGQPKRREREGRPPAPGARGYSWEPFQKGHALRLTHGAYHERTIGPLAAELAERLVSAYPDLGAPRYRFSVSAWARAEARTALIELFLDAKGVVDAEGEPREKLLRESRAEQRRAAEERRNLGLDPASHSRLERERAEAVRSAVDLAGLRERGREALAAGDGEAAR